MLALAEECNTSASDAMRVQGPPPALRGVEGASAIAASPSSSSDLLLSILELSDTKVYEPCIRALRGTAAHVCTVVVLQLITVLIGPAFGRLTGRCFGRSFG